MIKLTAIGLAFLYNLLIFEVKIHRLFLVVARVLSILRFPISNHQRKTQKKNPKSQKFRIFPRTTTKRSICVKQSIRVISFGGFETNQKLYFIDTSTDILERGNSLIMNEYEYTHI